MQIIIFIIDMVSALINLAGSICGFKNPDNPTLIIQKQVHIHEIYRSNYQEPTTNYKKNQSQNTQTNGIHESVIVLYLLFIAALGIVIWLNNILQMYFLIIISLLSLLICCLYIYLGTRYTLETKEKIRNSCLLMQILPFNISLTYFKSAVNFDKTSLLFKDADFIEHISLMVSNITVAIPYAICHLFQLMFSVLYIFMLITLMCRLSFMMFDIKNRFVVKLAFFKGACVPSILTISNLIFPFILFNNLSK